jgi:ATP-dependent protease ClpP protease subunit
MAVKQKPLNGEFYLREGIDVDKRRLTIDSEIDEYSTGMYIRAITMMLDKNMKDPIFIDIACPGGDVYQGLRIYDLLESCPCPIKITGTGLVASMAFIVYLAGDERRATERATFMNHYASDVLFGNIEDLKIGAKELERLEEICFNILEAKTKKKKRFWKSATKKGDGYYNKKQCLDLGVVTHVE